MFYQGEILSIENIAFPVVIASKDFFNKSGLAIGCPIVEKASESPLHLQVNTNKVQGYIYAEELRLYDLQKRRYKKLDTMDSLELINFVDTVQGIFDYI